MKLRSVAIFSLAVNEMPEETTLPPEEKRVIESVHVGEHVRHRAFHRQHRQRASCRRDDDLAP